MKPATIKDIARKLDVHHSTVSRALRHHPDISVKTRKMVIETAEELNYRPNPVALSLRDGGAVPAIDRLVVIVPISPTGELPPFLSPLVQAADTNQFEVVLRQQTGVLDAAQFAEIEKTRPSGIVLELPDYVQFSSKLVQAMKRSHVPVVVLAGTHNMPDLAGVLISTATAVRKAIHHLSERGARRIALVAGAQSRGDTAAMVDAYREALLDNFAPVLAKMIVLGANGRLDGIEAARQLMRDGHDRPDAILALNDQVAVGIMQEISAQGIVIPDQIRIVSLRESSLAPSAVPALSACRFGPSEIAQKLLGLICETLDDPDEERQLFVEPDFVLRESS